LTRLPWRPVVWILLHLLLLLVSFSPLAVVTLALVMTPLVVVFVQQPLARFIAFYAAGLALIAVLLPGFGIVAAVVSLFFLPTAVVMGVLYKRRSPARAVLLSGTLTLLAQLLLTLVIATAFGFSVTAELRQFLEAALANVPEPLKASWTEESHDALVRLITQLLPLYFICFSGLSVIVTHVLARNILNRSGERIPGMRPAREWMLPKSLVWYYMIALALDFFISDQSDNLVTMALRNIIPLLMIAFTVQSIAFLFYMAHVRQWNRALPVAAIGIVIVFPYAQYLFSLLGVMDVAFPIRERIAKNK